MTGRNRGGENLVRMATAFAIGVLATTSAHPAQAQARPAEPIAPTAIPTVRAESLDAPSVGHRVGYQVVLPAGYDPSHAYPTLWLLHGYGGSASNWLQRTKLLRYVERDPFVVILPSAGDSWYVDAASAPQARYEDLVMRDVYDDVRHRFAVDTARQAIAGLSMGGYGALTLALRYPGRFQFAGGMSAALFTEQDLEHPDSVFAPLLPSLRAALGDPAGAHRAAYDPFALATRVPAGSLPYVYLTVGTHDGYRTFLPRNRALADTLRARRAAYEYRERPGAHAWTFWDPELGALMDRAWEVLNPPLTAAEPARRRTMPAVAPVR